MEQSRQSEQQKLTESLTEFFATQCWRADEQRRCTRCGALMQHLDATFWLYGTDSGWNVCLPLCQCEGSSPLGYPKRSTV